MRTHITLSVAVLVCSAVGSVQTADPEYVYPLFKDHGGILPLPEAAEQPRENSKVVIDITSDETANGVIKGLDRAALISNQYAHAGVGPRESMKMVIILHGKATKAALSDDAYVQESSSYLRQAGLKGNPNLKLMKKLAEAGVEIFVCGQALAHHGFAASEVASPARVAVSAATVNINHQMNGYAYLPFH